MDIGHCTYSFTVTFGERDHFHRVCFLCNICVSRWGGAAVNEGGFIWDWFCHILYSIDNMHIIPLSLSEHPFICLVCECTVLQREYLVDIFSV